MSNTLIFKQGTLNNFEGKKNNMINGTVGFTTYPESSEYTIYLKNNNTFFNLMPHSGTDDTKNYPLISGGAGIAPKYEVLNLSGGGTGVTELTTDRLLYVNEDNLFSSSNHTITNDQIAINSTSTPSAGVALLVNNGFGEFNKNILLSRLGTNYLYVNTASIIDGVVNTNGAIGLCCTNNSNPAYVDSVLITNSTMYPGQRYVYYSNPEANPGQNPRKPHGLGTTDYRWEALYIGNTGVDSYGPATVKTLKLTDDSGAVNNIEFSAATSNYLRIPYNSNLFICAAAENETSSTSATSPLGINRLAVYPGASDTYTLGFDNLNGTIYRWKKIYAGVDGINSTGPVVIETQQDLVNGAHASIPLTVGSTSSSHIEIDGNEIQAKTSSETAGALTIQAEGGDLVFGGGLKFYKKHYLSGSSTATTVDAGRWVENSTFDDTKPHSSALVLGNSTAEGTKGNLFGNLRLYNQLTGYADLRYYHYAQDGTGSATSGRVVYLRDHGVANAYLVSTDTRSAVGSQNLPIYVNNKGVVTTCSIGTTKDWWTKAVNVDSSGVTKIGLHLDFHLSPDSSNSYDTRIAVTEATKNILYLPGITGQIVTHTNDTQIGTTAKPVYVANTGAVTACTPSSVFSALSWTGGNTAGPVLNATIATQLRTAQIPSASATASGVVTTGDQTFAGNKTVNGSITSQTTTTEAQVVAKGPAGNIYLYSHSNSSGNRGIYGHNAAGEGGSYLEVNKSNQVFLRGTADNATLLNPTESNATGAKGTWKGSIPSSGKVVWREAFTHSGLNSDSGDIVFWMQNQGSSATLNVLIDGCFYQNGQTGFEKVIDSSGGTITGLLTTSKLHITNHNDINLTAGNVPPFRIGNKDETHMEMDNNEIMCKNGETATSTLYIQAMGGNTAFGGNLEMEAGKQITRAGVSTSWYLGRDQAIVRSTSNPGYSPVVSLMAGSYSWEMGSYSADAYSGQLLFTAIKTSDYNSDTNTVTEQYRFTPSGRAEGKVWYSTYYSRTANYGTGTPNSNTPGYNVAGAIYYKIV